MPIDRSPSSADLLPLHEVAFPVHHHLSHLAHELVVSVLASAAVPVPVSTPVAGMLAPVLASPVVFVLDETVVALDSVVIAVFAAEAVVVTAVSAAETVVVAAVVSGPAVWVHHDWSAHRGRLLQS